MFFFLYKILRINIQTQNVNSKDVSKISIKSLLTSIAYSVYANELTTQITQDAILISSDFFVFINFIVCGKYEMSVHTDIIHNKIFPNILLSHTFL